MRIRSSLPILASLLAALSTTSAHATNPRCRTILPHGGQRGTEVQLTLRGQNLEDAVELMQYDRGLEVVSFTVPEDEKRKGREIDVVAKIAPDCPLGSQRLRVRTATGLSELFNFWVGTLPIVEEKEPNTDFAEPQPISLDVTVHGLIKTEDVDHYAVDLRKGERINIEVVGLRLGASPGNGNNFFDPFIAILDENRFEVASTDDVSLVWNDPIVSFIPPADGRYIVQVRDVAYNGDDNAYYLMHIGKFPRPTAIFPLGGKPGENLTLHYLGDAAKEFDAPFTVPTATGQLAHVEATDETGIAPSSHPFRVSPLENIFEQEPNNSRETPTVATAPAAWNGRLAEPDDVDFYKFSAKKGDVYQVAVYARRLRSAADTVLSIYDASGKRIAQNDDNRQPDSELTFNAPADGNYFAEIRDQLGGGGPAFVYRVELAKSTPSVAATTVESRRYFQPQLVIPAGGAFGVQINVTRNDVGGPAAIKPENLPPGVTVEMPAEWTDGATMPVILRAAADAPVGAAWTTFHLQCGDPSKPESLVHGLLSQQILLVRGQNNDRIWEEEQRRLPVVVTQAAPFRVRLEEPKAPVVQSGSIPLKVVVERNDGFNDSIRVLLVQNPPGCSSANATEIPPDKNEVIIPLNAAANAQTKTWPIAVRAISRAQRPQGQRSQGGGGRRGGGGVSYETASNWVPLRVEGPYFKLDFQQAVVEQAAETKLTVKVEKLRDFDGEADIKLVGLPANATADPLKATKDIKELTFTVKAAADTPVGQNKNLLCEVSVPVNGEQVPQTLGTGRLRVDPMPKEKPKATETASTAKPASRLEQLRQEQAAREANQK